MPAVEGEISVKTQYDKCSEGWGTQLDLEEFVGDAKGEILLAFVCLLVTVLCLFPVASPQWLNGGCCEVIRGSSGRVCLINEFSKNSW